MSYFHQTLDTSEKILNEMYVRELMDDGLAWCTTNMTVDDLRKAIFADLLYFGMWEKERNKKLFITFDELTKFVNKADIERIRQQLDNEEIKYLINVTEGIYNLKDERQIYQAAMDFCGCWFEGFEIPSGLSDVYTINHDVLDAAVTTHGGLENLATSLAMDLIKTNDVSSKVN
ncbi:hypothetical protein [Flavobacterium sp.]|jgi:hypothetical protein|uniref:hypothetical protein n=1 Tax=Flavobacterium sp. TaxID=239 RepID=UPI0037BE395B